MVRWMCVRVYVCVCYFILNNFQIFIKVFLWYAGTHKNVLPCGGRHKAHSVYLINKLLGRGYGSQYGDYMNLLLRPDPLTVP